MRNILSILMLVILFTACADKKADNTAIIKLKIEGLAKDCEFEMTRGYDTQTTRKVNIKNGVNEFRFDNVNEPELAKFICQGEGKHYMITVFVEAGENVFEGRVVSWPNVPNFKRIDVVVIKGHVANQQGKEWRDAEIKLRGELINMKAKSREEMNNFFRDNLEKWQYNWIKEHPNSWYSSYEVDMNLSDGADAETHELLLSYLDPNMDNKHVRNLKGRLKNLRSTDIKLEDLIQAKNVRYKVDQSYKGSDYKNVTYMTAIDGNKVCMLNNEGQFKIVNANGKLLKSFRPEAKSPATSFAVSANNEIYALTPNYKTIVKKHRGKEIKKQIVEGVECIVLDAKGTEKKRFHFEGLGSASGAKFMNNQLIVSDFGTAKLHVFDAKTGEKKSEITDMRPCCGILDFCVGENNQLLVADLGAFRVQGYKLDGNKVLAFGKRGRGIDEFHGCCNPVNIGRLSNGAIVTVEKSPTRIKIYSQEGAHLIDGVEELVKGCAYIPMAIDNKDNLYLASPNKGLVKCVAKV